MLFEKCALILKVEGNICAQKSKEIASLIIMRSTLKSPL